MVPVEEDMGRDSGVMGLPGNDVRTDRVIPSEREGSCPDWFELGPARSLAFARDDSMDASEDWPAPVGLQDCSMGAYLRNERGEPMKAVAVWPARRKVDVLEQATPALGSDASVRL